MHVLDECVADRHRETLRRWRIRTRKVGIDFGRGGTTDENVIPLLHQANAVTFFTRDPDYYQPRLRHAKYCLVFLRVPEERTPGVIRDFLRHPAFRTWAQRRGTVIEVKPTGMRVWRLKVQAPEDVPW
jgi:hypothetical protein